MTIYLFINSSKIEVYFLGKHVSWFASCIRTNSTTHFQMVS